MLPPSELEPFRSYLAMLVRVNVDPRLRRKLSESDLVQQTMVEAWRQMPRLPESERPAWLRRVLLNNIADEIRKRCAGRRDWRKEQALAATSGRLELQLAAEQSSPSERMQQAEDEAKLLAALAELPESQREALILQHWQGWTIAAIAHQMGRTEAAVGGLIKRGLKELRQVMGAAK